MFCPEELESHSNDDQGWIMGGGRDHQSTGDRLSILYDHRFV